MAAPPKPGLGSLQREGDTAGERYWRNILDSTPILKSLGSVLAHGLIIILMRRPARARRLAPKIVSSFVFAFALELANAEHGQQHFLGVGCPRPGICPFLLFLQMRAIGQKSLRSGIFHILSCIGCARFAARLGLFRLGPLRSGSAPTRFAV